MYRQGWECPKCGSVWAPHIGGCNNCNLRTSQKEQQENKEKERQLQNLFVQRLNRQEREEIERQVHEQVYPDVDPFGPGRMAPNPYHQFHGKVATRLVGGPTPPDTK